MVLHGKETVNAAPLPGGSSHCLRRMAGADGVAGGEADTHSLPTVLGGEKGLKKVFTVLR